MEADSSPGLLVGSVFESFEAVLKAVMGHDAFSALLLSMISSQLNSEFK